MNSKEIKKKVEEEKYIHTNVMFEVVGKPKEHIESSLKGYLKTLQNDGDLIIIKEEFEAAVEQEDGVWSAIAEVEMLVNSLNKLNWLCMNFMPASIEIMSPENLMFKANELTGWFNDSLAKTHEIAFMSQNIGQQNKVMLKSINALMRNFVLLAIDSKITSLDKISKKLGVLQKDLEPLLQAMIQEKTIKKNKKDYIRA